MSKREKPNRRGDEFTKRKYTVSKSLAKSINTYYTRQILPMICPGCQCSLLKCRQAGRSVTLCSKCGALNEVEAQQENI
jgi:hypothetical protein